MARAHAWQLAQLLPRQVQNSERIIHGVEHAHDVRKLHVPRNPSIPCKTTPESKHSETNDPTTTLSVGDRNRTFSCSTVCI